MAHKHLTSHDRFFRSSMADLKTAKEFFHQHLPATIKDIIDFNSIKPQKDSFVGDDLSSQIADMLYSINFNGKQGYLYLLVEHQSTIDPMMPLRLLKYILAIIDNHRKKTRNNKLPIIYPIVFYTGPKTYSKSTDLFDLFEDQRELAKNILFGPYQLIDLTQISDHKLKEYLRSGIMAGTMKHVPEKDILLFLKDILKDLQIIEKEDGTEYIIKIFKYVVKTGEIKNQNEFIQTIKTHQNRFFRKNGRRSYDNCRSI